MPHHTISRRRIVLLAIASALLCAYLSRSILLAGIGRALVDDQGPGQAEVAVVLAGDYTGHRICRAAEMVRQGYVKSILVSGPVVMYGRPESELAIPFAVERGYPAEWFVPIANHARNTVEEAQAIYSELQRRHIRSFLLITSDYHTGRAARVFRNTGRAFQPAVAMRVVAAPDPAFGSSNTWWRGRETQKTVFFEVWKNLAYSLGI